MLEERTQHGTHPQSGDSVSLVTESRNQRSFDLDMLGTKDILTLINEEDQNVALAVAREIPQITKAVDLITRCLMNNGRLFYVGAGTSGRLGVLDLAECKPTFGVGSDKVCAIIAGGPAAITEAVEEAEDDFELGSSELVQRSISERDAVLGITASGRTPFVLGALSTAREAGALTVGLSCNRSSKIREYVDIAIEVVTGPEVLTGSTRMKAGTAQKLVLNMISTATMIKLGKVYENLMVDMLATNSKLRIRAQEIVRAATSVPGDEAEALLKLADYNLKTAIVMGKLDVDRCTAEKLLAEAHGFVRKAIETGLDNR